MQVDTLLASDDSRKMKKAFFAVTSKPEKQLNPKKRKSSTSQEGIVQSLDSYIFNRVRKAKQEICSKKAKNRNYNFTKKK